jgi:branched-chain amino acid transport system substrate-binding protein
MKQLMCLKPIAVAGTLILSTQLISSSAYSADDAVTVGFAASFSGWLEAYSGPAVNAAMIAIDDINANGGLLGKKILTVRADVKSDRVEGAKAGRNVLAQGAEMVVVDCDYEIGASAALAAQSAGKISIFTCAGGVMAGIQGVGPFSFNASVLAGTQGATIAEWGYKNKNWRKAYILQDSSIEYSKDVCYGFDWMFREQLGGEIIGHDVFVNGDPSIASQITRIRNLPEPPDVIELCSYIPGGASAIRQIRAAGISVDIAGSSAMTGTYWLDSVPDLSRHYVPEMASIYGDDPRPEVLKFNEKFKERYGEYPSSSQGVYAGYNAIQLWAKGVEKAGTFEATAVTAAMETFRDEPTLVGKWTYTNTLHNQDSAPMVIVETTNGKPHVVDPEFRISSPVPMDALLGKRYPHVK